MERSPLLPLIYDNTPTLAGLMLQKAMQPNVSSQLADLSIGTNPTRIAFSPLGAPGSNLSASFNNQGLTTTSDAYKAAMEKLDTLA
jgi:hypothetical protein